jgi:hypothetical protein
MRWSYGATTVPERKHDLLPRTLASLALGGFDKPRLFVDGQDGNCSHSELAHYEALGLPVTYRCPRMGTVANWALGLWELYAREPACHYYAMFQDDVAVCRNLRQYLEKLRRPSKEYWNLYTFPCNQTLCTKPGWNRSDQLGRGAVALVFDRDAVQALLSSDVFVGKPASATRPRINLDGGVVTALTMRGWTELVHNPSLCQHMGEVTTMGSRKHAQAPSFPGEEFDCLTLPTPPLEAVQL